MRGVSNCQRGNLAVVVLAIGVAALCGDSAFAQQKPPSAPVTVVNTTVNPVPVTATAPLPVAGTVTLTQPVTVEETFAPGRSPKRYGPTDAVFTSSLVGKELVPPVAEGQTFILMHLEAVVFSNNSGFPLFSGACHVQLRQGDTYTSVIQMPLVNGGGTLAGSQPLFLPLTAGEGLYVSCSGATAAGILPSQGARMMAGGYFVPASQ